ncbi:unnamed protein product [Effrenium voratum]|nr:unnamed protein product [Effrenium voratum]
MFQLVGVQDGKPAQRASQLPGTQERPSQAQDQWKSALQEMLTQLPVALGPDEEAARNTALLRIRECVAWRWKSLMEGLPRMSKQVFREQAEEIQEHLNGLKEIHGHDMPFAPVPSTILAQLENAAADDASGSAASERDSSSRTSSTQSETMGAAKFKFLSKDSTVWTVMQVGESEQCDGYCHFLAANEWYQLKTPFSQWFTKNWCTVASEIGAEWKIVVRKSGYKGAFKAKTGPLDGATVLGICQVLASVLPAASMQMAAVKSCLNTLSFLESFVSISTSLPTRGSAALDVSNNMIPTTQLKALLKDEGFAKKLPVPEAAELSVATCLVAFFRARGDGQSHANVAVSRLVRHLVHVFCQHVETQIARRLLSHCPDPSHEARLHPFLGHARRRGSKALELSLIQRFTAKGGGFVSTAGELSLQRLGVVKQGSSLAQRTGSEYVARSLIHTAEFVSDYVSRASPVVLSLVLRLDGRHFAGPTQMLPQGPDDNQAAAALVTFTQGLKNAATTPTGSKPVAQTGAFDWKEYRQATKAVLSAMANSLRQCLPNGWSLNKCKPQNILAPRGLGSDRLPLLPEEASMMMIDLPEGAQVFFVYNFKTLEARPDFFLDSHRLVFAGDEGTEALSLLIGFLCFLHLAAQSIWICYWPDMLHKISRKVALAVNSHPDCKALVKRMQRVFRYTRAPFASCRFGQQNLSARKQLLLAVKRGEAIDLVDMWLPNVARDVGSNPVDFSVQQLITLLEESCSPHLVSTESKDVRWMSFYDHAVLVDAANQDQLRSMIKIFAPLREFLAEYDRDMQRKPNASVTHAVALATGQRTKKLISRTITAAVGKATVEYCGILQADPDLSDKLAFHSHLLLCTLSSLHELASYHQAWPWRCAAALDPSQLDCLLKSMHLEWDFVKNVPDVVSPTHQIWAVLSHTRWQCYRELFTTAEFFGFDVSKMKLPVAAPFKNAIKSVLGLTGDNARCDSLLSSLHCELSFNDARDACRRAKKSERSLPANLHSVHLKSSICRSSGCPTLELQDHHWEQRIPKRSIQSQVHQALRVSDRQLGICCEGLTRHKSNRLLSKPHVVTARLGLMRGLVRAYHDAAGTEEEKMEAAIDCFSNSWMSKLVSPRCFLKDKNTSLGPRMVLRAGPFTVLTLGLVPDGDAFLLTHYEVQEFVVTSLDQVEIATCDPVMVGDWQSLAYRQRSEFRSLVQHEDNAEPPHDHLEGQSEDEELAETLKNICVAPAADNDDADQEQAQEQAGPVAAEPAPAAEPALDAVPGSSQVRADEGGAHASHQARGRPEGEFAPGIRADYGNPANASQFIQAYLPTGFVFQGRKSKTAAYASEGCPRGTQRTKAAAVLAVQSWTWQWWASLTPLQQSSIQESEKPDLEERSAKRARVD